MTKEIAKMISPTGLQILMDTMHCANMSLCIPVEVKYLGINRRSFENSKKSHITSSLSPQGSRNLQLTDILIVDDYEINLEILKRQISRLQSSCKCSEGHEDYSIHLARSGIQAVNLVQDQERLKGGYKLILMDCQMPEMDGWEATRTICSLFKDKRISILPHIIAYSAFDSDTDIQKCYSCGMNGYISKPCYPEELCKTITEWLTKPVKSQAL